LEKEIYVKNKRHYIYANIFKLSKTKEACFLQRYTSGTTCVLLNDMK